MPGLDTLYEANLVSIVVVLFVTMWAFVLFGFVSGMSFRITSLAILKGRTITEVPVFPAWFE